MGRHERPDERQRMGYTGEQAVAGGRLRGVPPARAPTATDRPARSTAELANRAHWADHPCGRHGRARARLEAPKSVPPAEHTDATGRAFTGDVQR